MATPTFDDVARRLLREHASGARYHGLSPDTGVTNVEAAYAVQRRYVDLMIPEAGAPAMAGWGLGSVGDIAEGPDGNLYEWVQGVDGLGNPIGFWKRLKRGKLASRLAETRSKARPQCDTTCPPAPRGLQ